MTSTTDESCGGSCQSRRTLLLAGAVGVTAVLTGCQTYGAESAGPVPDPANATASEPPGSEEPIAPGSEEPIAPGSEEPVPDEPGGEVLAAVSDLPIGGGLVLAAKGVVLTHPEEGNIKAFSAKCTHAGCNVNEIAGGTINCPCHGSKFRMEDGSVADGPANGPLAAVKVTVDGDNVRLA